MAGWLDGWMEKRPGGVARSVVYSELEGAVEWIVVVWVDDEGVSGAGRDQKTSGGGRRLRRKKKEERELAGKARGRPLREVNVVC